MLDITNKAKENQFKILHDYIASNKLLYKIKVRDSPRCNFCDLFTQDTNHLFFNCMCVKNFWFRVRDWLQREHHVELDVELKTILLGHLNACNLINKVTMYGKLFIFKCKYNNVNPNLDNFVAYLEKNQYNH